MYPEINKFSEKFRSIYAKYAGDVPYNESWEDFSHFLFEVWSNGYEKALIDCNSMDTMEDEDGILGDQIIRKSKRNKRQEKYSFHKHQDRPV